MNKIEFDRQPIIGCLSLLKENLLLVLGIVITIVLGLYSIMGVYGFSVFPDEFGYWAPAAAMLGYDWSDIASLGSYYSYGYSALLVGVLFLFKGAISTYRAAVILNLILHCISIPLLYKLLFCIFPKTDKNMRALVALFATLYPAWVYYTQTTMAEALLYFVFILASYLMMSFIKKPGVLRGIFFVLVLVYCYLVHMRCIGTIGAGILTIVLWLFGNSRKNHEIRKKAWLLPVLIVVLFGASFIIKKFVIGNVYSGASAFVISWNDYSSIPERLIRMVTGNGLKYLLQDICGKLFYLGLSSFGIGYFGLYALFVNGFGSLKKLFKKQAEDKDILWIFFMLAVIAQFLVALVYLNGAANPDNNRLDLFLHGRYIDFVMPMLIGIGLVEMIEGRSFWPVSIITFVLYIAFYFVARSVISVNNTGMENAQGIIMVGMSYLLGEPPVSNTLLYLRNETLLQAGLTLLVMLLVFLYRKIRHDTVIWLLVILHIVLGIIACDHYVLKLQSYVYGDVQMGDTLKDVRQMHPDKTIIHYFEGGYPYVELVQFNDRTADIHAVNASVNEECFADYLRDDIILIIAEDSENAQAADDYFRYSWTFGHLSLYYND